MANLVEMAQEMEAALAARDREIEELKYKLRHAQQEVEKLRRSKFTVAEVLEWDKEKLIYRQIKSCQSTPQGLSIILSDQETYHR